MSTNLVALRADDSVRDAVEAMLKNKISAVFIMDKGGCVGTVTQKDILRAMICETVDLHSRLDDIMTRPPKFLCLAERFSTLVIKMARGEYDLLPVLDANNVPVGTVSTMDLVIAQAAEITGTIALRECDILSTVDANADVEAETKAA